MSVYLLATLDTKGTEAAFVREELRRLGHKVVIVDTGCLGLPAITADVSREKVFEAAGTTLSAMVDRNDRGEAIKAAAAGATQIVLNAQGAGTLSGVLALGGSAGTTIGTAAMRALPIGVPKLMVSTLASGQVRHYVGDRDILMLNSIVDILGVNLVSRMVLANAARAMAGMAAECGQFPEGNDKPLIAATMFGVTTPCVEKARQVLTDAGNEVLIFHATGAGGQAMESLIKDGLISGVLDITTTELADELVGGFLTAGPERLTAAGKRGVPQVVSVGATDMVNFHGPETVPAQFKDRKFYQHNASVTLMRTTAEENTRIGRDIAHKVAQAKGPAVVMLPKQGVSAIDRTGQTFDDPQAREALFAAAREGLPSRQVIDVDAHINDPEFAVAAAEKLLELMRSRA